MKCITRHIILIFCILWGTSLYAQNDIGISNYMFDEISYNPSFTGEGETFRASLLARKQWLGMEGSPLFQTLSVDGKTKNIGGLGLHVVNDKIGFENQITATVNYSYGVNIGNLLTVNSSPRSRLMAEAIEKTGLIERSGQGVDLMCANCVKEGKPLPDYSTSDDYQVNLRLYGVIPDETFYLFTHEIMRNAEMYDQLNAFDWITLHHVLNGKADAGYEESLEKLEKLGLVNKDSYFRYVLSSAYVAKKPNVKNMTQRVDAETLAKVYYVIKRKGEAAMSDFVEAFDGMLTQKQVRTLIESLCSNSLLAKHGNARATRYVWA